MSLISVVFFLAFMIFFVTVTKRYWFAPAWMRFLVAAQPRWDLRALRVSKIELGTHFRETRR